MTTCDSPTWETPTGSRASQELGDQCRTFDNPAMETQNPPGVISGLKDVAV